MTTVERIEARELTEREKEDFVAGWRAAGGYMGDYPAHYRVWCMPWTYAARVEIIDGDAYSAGAKYWARVKSEVAAATAAGGWPAYIDQILHAHLAGWVPPHLRESSNRL